MGAGMAHTKDRWMAAGTVFRAASMGGLGGPATLPPVVARRRSRPSVDTSRLPSRSVRATRAPEDSSRSMVAGAGWP